MNKRTRVTTRHHIRRYRRRSWMFNPLESFIDASVGKNLHKARKMLLAFAQDDDMWDQITKAQALAAQKQAQSDHLSKLTKKYFG